MTHACAPPAGQSWYLCNLNRTNMPIKVCAWFHKVKVSHRPLVPPQGAHRWVLQLNTVWNGDVTVTENYDTFHHFPRTPMVILLSAMFHGPYDQLALLSPKGWQLVPIICKTTQQEQKGNATRLKIEGTCNSNQERNRPSEFHVKHIWPNT